MERGLEGRDGGARVRLWKQKLFLRPGPPVSPAPCCPQSPRASAAALIAVSSVVPINCPVSWRASSLTCKPCLLETGLLPRNGPKFLVRPSLGVPRWGNAVTVNFREGGTRIETTKLCSRKHEFLYQDGKIFPQWEQVN